MSFTQKLIGRLLKEIFVTRIVTVSTEVVGTAFSTKVVEIAAKETLFLQSLLEQLFPQ